MDDYRIGIVSELILGVSYRIVSATFVSAAILRAALQVQQLLTGCIIQEIKGRSRPSPAACERRWSTTIREGSKGREF